jgi:type IV secretory pathway VirB10-like protein
VSNSQENNSQERQPEVKPIEAPAGLDLHPKPRTPVQVSKRVGVVLGIVVLALLLGYAYGAYRRQVHTQTSARDSALPKAVMPATASASEVEEGIPSGNAPLVRSDPNQLLFPDAGNGTTMPSPASAPCGFDPRTGQPFRFNPETGQPCAAQPQTRTVVRQPNPPVTQPAPAPTEQAPEERRIAAAYQREREALVAPTGIRAGGLANSFGSFPAASARQAGGDGFSQVAALSREITDRTSGGPLAGSAPRPAEPRNESEYDAQNMQTIKTAFLAAAEQRKTANYLRSTRTAPLSSFEIKAGWEIPAVLEQSLNSDLPGDIKALVDSNVFDTATGRYLLIPQGARLVGKYDSRISYGQNGVEVVWDRIIFPDASSIDINGMVGLDAHGNSGLRYDVDHHYKRLFGFAALTSAFEAAFGLSQRNTQSALTYPSATSVAGAAIGQELSQTGATITRRNLNIQPTIKVPAGYKFTVRVNRDILFDVPYQPIEANPLPAQPPEQLRRRDGFSGAAYEPGH